MNKEELQAISAKAREELLARREERLERARAAREERRARRAERLERARERRAALRQESVDRAIETIGNRVQDRARRGRTKLIYSVGRNTLDNREKAREIADAFAELDGRVSIKTKRVADYDYYYGTSYSYPRYVRVVVSW